MASKLGNYLRILNCEIDIVEFMEENITVTSEASQTN